MKLLRGKLTYANVVATLCLFLLVAGGSAFAATQLAKNSVGTKQLKNNAVTSAKVKDHSLQATDFKAGELPAGKDGIEGKEGKAWTPGPTTLQISPENWVAGSGGGTIQYFTTRAALSGSGSVFFNAGATVPSTLQGRAVQIDGMELCYEASATAQLEKVILQIQGTLVVEDLTARTDSTCRSYNLPSPATIGENFVNVVLKVKYTAATALSVSRLTLKLTD